MKKIFTLLLIVCVLQAHAQTPFPTMAFVDINNIKASVLVHGDMWWNPSTTSTECFFPASSTKNIGFNAALWMSGYDGSSALHIASQTYRQNGNDYWPGPLDATGALDLATSTKWARIWKVNRTTINTFRADTAVRTTTNTNAAILQWPGKGNVYARGAGAAPLTIDRDMAPFKDLNGNGIYEPLLGEYPDIVGDQGLWWLISDNGPTHDETMGLPLGVEVKTLAYGYNRGTLIDNVIFYDYTITNRSTNNYTNFRIGQFADMDLGSAFNDYVGFDSVHRMGIAYNGQPFDSVYGTNLPIAGITMIILPGDTATTYVPAGSFMYYNNDTSSIIGNPFGDIEYNNYLRATTRTGMHISNDYTTAGVPTVGYGSGPSTNYVYPGDPSDLTKWSECSSGNTPGDRRFVVTSNDFTLPAGASKHVVMALVTTNLDTNNACGKPVHFTDIMTVADTAWKTFFTPLPPVGVTNTPIVANVNIYPNPAHDRLYVENASPATEETIIIYNSVGQAMSLPYNKSGSKYEYDLSSISAGVYYVIYRNSTSYKTSTFIKN